MSSKNIRTPEQLRADQLRARVQLWRKIGRWFTSRSRDLAMIAIVVGSGIAVFDGALYSARTFGFVGISAVAFALMPDALMVLSAAKMRQVGITPTQHATARKSMRFGLGFSLVTNMVAAFLRGAPEHWITPKIIFAGSIVYHGVVVLILWYATETLTKVRAGRAGTSNSGNSGTVGQAARKTAKPKPAAKSKVTKAEDDAPVVPVIKLAPPAKTPVLLRDLQDRIKTPTWQK